MKKAKIGQRLGLVPGAEVGIKLLILRHNAVICYVLKFKDKNVMIIQ